MEKKIVTLTILISLGLSLSFGDLYPFSINPLFTKKITRFSFINLKDQDDRRLSNLAFKTYLDYGSQFEKTGIALPPTINVMGKTISQEELKAHLKNELPHYPSLKEIKVSLKNIHIGPEKKPTVETFKFSIINPSYDPLASKSAHIYKRDKFLKRIKNEELL